MLLTLYYPHYALQSLAVTSGSGDLESQASPAPGDTSLRFRSLLPHYGHEFKRMYTLVRVPAAQQSFLLQSMLVTAS